ncbi:hypothetical protein [Falsigemmobacter faecalis]|uniref:Antifreeze glycopeptide polyprotein n=1 Tax=Falsigemmobacter faecalis TaxID=2488730 RepID=A0A3P3DQC8_9RHOB|nr:hypothetical protein [Falsigemmobacter faecalis]RRH76415.1 hypothetical protein EG244_06570 [Falsigemmobacter faecalis]
MVTEGLRALLLTAALLGPGAALAQGRPLSAIDWLSDTVARPAPRVVPEAPLRPLGAPEAIVTTPLSARNPDGIGALTAKVTGIDPQFWARSDAQVLKAKLRDEGPEPLPALRDLIQMLMLAELDPPMNGDGQGGFLLARIDRLLSFGALEAAQELVTAAGPPTPDLFRRAFDIALLLGTEDRACAAQRASPRISPTLSARIFCLARGGDWGAAELTLATAQALGHVADEEVQVLQRFIRPEAYEEEDPLPPPARVTPLNLRLYEAIGEALSPAGQPLAFAHGDLTPATGWKAQIEAAERLARTGGIAPAQLFRLYTERRAAASGGVWSRVQAVQRFEKALSAADPEKAAAALKTAWTEMASMELEVPFAEHYASRIREMSWPGGEPRELAFRLRLLSTEFATILPEEVPPSEEAAFLAGLAQGRATSPPPPDNLARAIARAFPGAGEPPLPSGAAQGLLRDGRLGEAAFLAIDQVTVGALGELRTVTEGLVTLRRLGFETAARKAALQLLILERRG